METDERGAVTEYGGEQAIVLRLTGEIFDPGDPENCLGGLRRVSAAQAQLAEVKRALQTVLAQYATERGERTVTLPDGSRYERTGGPEKRYDAVAIRRGLLEAGMPKERVDEIVVSTVELKVNGTEANKAARNNPAYKAVIEAGTEIIDKPYTVAPK